MADSELCIIDIQRMSTEDGPGLRTTVFFKGCNLACPWCHNPESINKKPDLIWYSDKCAGCGACMDACPQKGISRDGEGLSFNRPLCLACGSCAEECPGAAIELKGRTLTVQKLAAELVKDKAYFGADGGITLSGGEAMIQHEAALRLAQALKKEGINVALDTAGCYDFRLLEAMLPYVDTILYDIKIFDKEAHKRLTGADNSIILDNYRRLAEKAAGGRPRIWVRTPIIEGATDNAENIAAIGEFLASIRSDASVGNGKSRPPEKWELCAFNNLCRDKYKRLDLEWAYRETGLTEKAHIIKLTEIARSYVPGAEYSGSVRE